MIGGVVFDLDDTLYLERDYVLSGFRRVAHGLDGVDGLPAATVVGHLWKLFEEGIRGDTFNRLLTEYPGLARRGGVAELVRVYRTHEPEIGLLPGIHELLLGLGGKGYRLGLLSDGPLESQRAKVRALGLEEIFSPVVLTGAWGREDWKPSPRGYEAIARLWSLPASRLAYVGDNPDKDFVTPNRLGWHTIRLRLPGQLTFTREPRSAGEAARVEVGDPREIIALLPDPGGD